MTEEIASKNLYSKIAELLQAARQTVVRAVNQTMVYTYYEIGRMIVEDEQHGKERAEYGKQVLKELSKRLTADFGKGFSVENLDRMRFFYHVYSKSNSSTVLTNSGDNAISATPLRKSDDSGTNISSISQKPSAEFKNLHFQLSWSHYFKLMRIENPDERKFYEIECYQNNWSLKELQRQFDAALYERLALSRDKEAVRQLALQGQTVAKPEDAIKEPYVLEFLGLQAQSAYSEIVLCQDKSETLVEITLPEDNDQIFASRYQTVLPNKEELKRLLSDKDFEV